MGGKLADWMVGGAPGEDVATYLENCPHITFIGLNLYVPPESSVNDFRAALARYRASRNLPSITETNSDRTPVAPRLAYIAIGEFGAPIFAPWALNVSFLGPYQPYVLPDGTLANGAAALSDTYNSLRAALPQVSYYAQTDKLKVFMSRLPGQKFSETQDVNGAKVVVSGEDNGQAIVIHPAQNEYLIVGFRSEVSLWSPMFGWPGLLKVRVERGRYDGVDWKAEGPAAEYGVNPTEKALYVSLGAAQVVRIHW